MSTRNRPPRTPASAEPKPVMLRGTDFKSSRANDLLQSALVSEKPARAVHLDALGMAQPWHIVRPHAVDIADDPEDRHAAEVQLEVRLGEARAPQGQRGAGGVLAPETPAAPRLDRDLPPQREDAAAIDAPELRVEGGRHAGVMGRLEVAPADQWIEVPAGELNAGHGPDARVDGEELG